MRWWWLAALCFTLACNDSETPASVQGTQSASGGSEAGPGAGTGAGSGSGANVTDVSTSGAAGSYQFSVTIASPDTGCDQYADWWEVLDEDGSLLYRRILGHSHTSEQPFTRSGGPVPAQADDTVWIRAHMNPSGYGGSTMRGSVGAGFTATEMPDGFGADAERASPQPDGCAF